MHRLTILYGMPTDPTAFTTYYRETHIAIAKKMPGLTAWNLSWIDPEPNSEQEYILIAELYAESSDAMDAALSSPEGQAATGDLANFVTGSVTFLRGDEENVEL